MKLLAKLTLFSTFSKLLIAILFVLLIPVLMQRIAFRNTNKLLDQQKEKVINEVRKNGIDYYLQGEETYSGYTLLKGEYISIEPTDTVYTNPQLVTSTRLFEDGDTLNYRILTYTFSVKNKNYLLEIGKKISAIEEQAQLLQTAAFYILLLLIFITLISDYFYTKFVLSPLNTIIKSKLRNQQINFKETQPPIKTSTFDFKYLDESITDLKDRIRQAFEKEKEFTSNASHELMTPISIMQTKIENMSTDNNLTKGQYQKLEDLKKTLNRLKKIVSTLLFISRIENEQYINNDEVAPKLLITEILDELSFQIEEKSIQVKIQLSELMVLKNINKTLIFQLFYNLLHNAIRYNKSEGNIHIYDKKTEHLYEIHLSDTGVGMTQNETDEIFDRFKKNTKSAEGYGLGLSIVKSIITHQNIDIMVRSAPNKGTTFIIKFDASHF
ncbi:MAG: sensor histidine kinase [Niabella sp.]